MLGTFSRKTFIELLKVLGLRMALVGVLALASGVVAQDEASPDETEAASAELIASKVMVTPGETILITVKLKLANQAHANSNNPTDPLLIPTSFTPKKNDYLVWGAVEYPAPTEAIASYSPTPLQVFEDGSEIKVKVKINAKLKETDLVIEGVLRIQVCDDQKCYPPKRIPLSVPVRVNMAKAAPTKGRKT